MELIENVVWDILSAKLYYKMVKQFIDNIFKEHFLIWIQINVIWMDVYNVHILN